MFYHNLPRHSIIYITPHPSINPNINPHSQPPPNSEMPDRGNRRDRIPKPPAPQSNPLAEGLVLSFEHTDLRGLDEEGDNIVKAFRSIGCPCHKYSIKSERRVQDKLKRFLAEGATPRIIYFHGHGRSLDNSLTFSSHKSRQVGG